MWAMVASRLRKPWMYCSWRSRCWSTGAHGIWWPRCLISRVQFRTACYRIFDRHIAVHARGSRCRYVQKPQYVKAVTQQDTFKILSICNRDYRRHVSASKRSNGNMWKGKLDFSGKHKLYEFKTEASARPNGIAVLCSMHHQASVADIKLIQRMRDEHSGSLEKRATEEGFWRLGCPAWTLSYVTGKLNGQRIPRGIWNAPCHDFQEEWNNSAGRGALQQ